MTDVTFTRAEGSPRGLRHHAPLPSTDGETIAAYTSSDATDPHVWVKTTPAGALLPAYAHLPADVAYVLAQQLLDLVIHHHRGDGRAPHTTDDAIDTLISLLVDLENDAITGRAAEETIGDRAQAVLDRLERHGFALVRVQPLDTPPAS